MMKRITPKDRILSYLKKQIEEREDRVTNAMVTVGEICFNEAIRGGTYKDQTKILRGSIAYSVIKDGVVVKMKSRNEEGKSFIEPLAGRESKGIVLIVSAGANYALYVEARNFVVLKSSELYAKEIVPSIMKQLGFTVV